MEEKPKAIVSPEGGIGHIRIAAKGPNGGDYLEMFLYDENDQPCDWEHAVRGSSYEVTADGKTLMHSMWGFNRDKNKK